MNAAISRPHLHSIAFPRESDLVSRFVGDLSSGHSPWGALQIALEWDYRTGITDILARTDYGELIAFEAKLADWRRAIHQAYRNTVFAQRVYVVLPSATAMKAAKADYLFSRYNIGLCSVEDASISVLIDAPVNEVLIPWLRARAMTFFDNESNRTEARSIQSNRRRDLQSHGCVA